METSKVVPPPLGEPPSPSHSSYPPGSTKRGCEDQAAHRGEPGDQSPGPLQSGKKKSPASTLGAASLQKQIEERGFEMLFTESKTIVGLAVERHDKSGVCGGGSTDVPLPLCNRSRERGR